MVRLPGDRSAWWLIWRFFPGGTGIRGVARLELIVTLPMALGIAILIDRAAPRWRAAIIALAIFAVIEQIGATQSYSGASAEALSTRVGGQIPASCRAAYIVAPTDLIPPPPPPIGEAQFDAESYLAANPDVAAAWKGTPWEHYDRFGRAEHRSLDPAYSILRQRHAVLCLQLHTTPGRRATRSTRRQRHQRLGAERLGVVRRPL